MSLAKIAVAMMAVTTVCTIVHSNAGWRGFPDATPHLYRGHYRAQHDAGLECMATLCLAGPASEECFCGPIEDGSDQVDFEMAKHYLARRFGPLQLAAEIARLRDAAQRLLRTAWAEQRI